MRTLIFLIVLLLAIRTWTFHLLFFAMIIVTETVLIAYVAGMITNERLWVTRDLMTATKHTCGMIRALSVKVLGCSRVPRLNFRPLKHAAKCSYSLESSALPRVRVAIKRRGSVLLLSFQLIAISPFPYRRRQLLAQPSHCLASWLLHLWTLLLVLRLSLSLRFFVREL